MALYPVLPTYSEGKYHYLQWHAPLRVGARVGWRRTERSLCGRTAAYGWGVVGPPPPEEEICSQCRRVRARLEGAPCDS